jgi:hypothetical protein
MECADVTVNTNGNTTNIPGKELLIVNLPGYTNVPEWEVGAPSSVDGRDLLNSVEDISFKTQSKKEKGKGNVKSIKSVKKFNRIKQKVSKDNKVVDKNCNCITGEMKCNRNGFDTCVNNKWIYRDCASGTACKSSGDSIVCDFA